MKLDFDLENICQGNDMQHLHWRHSSVSINLDKVVFFDSSHRFPDFVYIYPEIV